MVDAGLKAQLIGAKDGGKGNFDMFRGRLMVPIRSPEGRVIAFGARQLLGDKGPKYLNSRESPLYIKGDTLYGLDVAREGIRKTGQAVLVEGYFDAIGLHQGGINNAVALCSTTVTPRQLDLLKRHGAKELVLYFLENRRIPPSQRDFLFMTRVVLGYYEYFSRARAKMNFRAMVEPWVRDGWQGRAIEIQALVGSVAELGRIIKATK